jgi:hypothetical protein
VYKIHNLILTGNRPDRLLRKEKEDHTVICTNRAQQFVPGTTALTQLAGVKHQETVWLPGRKVGVSYSGLSRMTVSMLIRLR